MTLDPSIPRVAGRRERREYLRNYNLKWRKLRRNRERLRKAAAGYARKHAWKHTAKKIKWRLDHPAAARAHGLVYKAVSRGKLIRPKRCQACGKICKPQAHHDDYRKPLQVKWWCAPCHKVHHLKEKR